MPSLPLASPVESLETHFSQWKGQIHIHSLPRRVSIGPPRPLVISRSASPLQFPWT